MKRDHQEMQHHDYELKTEQGYQSENNQYWPHLRFESKQSTSDREYKKRRRIRHLRGERNLQRLEWNNRGGGRRQRRRSRQSLWRRRGQQRFEAITMEGERKLKRWPNSKINFIFKPFFMSQNYIILTQKRLCTLRSNLHGMILSTLIIRSRIFVLRFSKTPMAGLSSNSSP